MHVVLAKVLLSIVCSIVLFILVYPFRGRRVVRVKDIYVKTIGGAYIESKMLALKEGEYLKRENHQWHVYKKVFYYERRRGKRI